MPSELSARLWCAVMGQHANWHALLWPCPPLCANVLGHGRELASLLHGVGHHEWLLHAWRHLIDSCLLVCIGVLTVRGHGLLVGWRHLVLCKEAALLHPASRPCPWRDLPSLRRHAIIWEKRLGLNHLRACIEVCRAHWGILQAR